MYRIAAYSLLMTLGIATAFVVDLTPIRFYVSNVTVICLAYIMIEVGLEFTINKRKLGTYAKDYLVAATAATFPWLFVAIYMRLLFDTNWSDALLIGHLAAPTSAGVLFTMLTAAGLGTTWLFKKARILALFDDIDTILMMIPLQILAMGASWDLVLVVPTLIALIWIAYRYLHTIKAPANTLMLVLYGSVIVFVSELIFHTTDVEIEIIVPAFVLGAILINPHDPLRPRLHEHEHAYMEPDEPKSRKLDATIKALFMFLVGASVPRLAVTGFDVWPLILHVSIISILFNIGKLVPAFCYKNEAGLRERLALAVSMFPRGELGAGILLITMGYDINKQALGVAQLSLALNLLLTGAFVWAVIALLQPKKSAT